MPVVRIDGSEIRDWGSFHEVFARELGFPDFYGKNMDAWVDCMTSLDDPEAGMTKVHGSAGDVVVLVVDHAGKMPGEILEALADSVAFVNWRRMEVGEKAILVLSYWKREAV